MGQERMRPDFSDDRTCFRDGMREQMQEEMRYRHIANPQCGPAFRHYTEAVMSILRANYVALHCWTLRNLRCKKRMERA